MRKNIQIILIAIIIIAILTTAAATFFMQTTHYKTIDINGYTLEVPESNTTVEQINDNYKTYNDQQNNITIKTYAINNVNETNYTGVNDINEQIKNNNATNTTIANKTVSNKSDTYTYYEQEQHQMIVITTKDKNTMEHILQNMNKTQIKPENAENINLTTIQENNNTNNTTQTTTTKKKTTTKTSTQREEDKITPDGWNPKQHEVSRESLGDGNQKVHYDDGYFRVVDRKGNILTYGY